MMTLLLDLRRYLKMVSYAFNLINTRLLNIFRISSSRFNKFYEWDNS